MPNVDMRSLGGETIDPAAGLKVKVISQTAGGNAEIGALTETAPATDTASSGLNGRLQRIAQRLTNLLAKAATATLANVSSSATSVTLLAANTARIGATIFNDSSAILYVKLGTTASATSYTIQMAAGSYYEVPFGFNGRIDGIWASANGSARVTELT